jgi:hypothetical protein
MGIFESVVAFLNAALMLGVASEMRLARFDGGEMRF